MSDDTDQRREKLTNKERIEIQQLELCMALGSRDWDLFTPSQHAELRSKISFALFGPPKTYIADSDASPYTPKQNEKVDAVYQAITAYGSFDRVPGTIYMSVIFVFGEYLEDKIFQCPVFRIRKCHPQIDELEYFKQLRNNQVYGFNTSHQNLNYCQIYIDDEARVYGSWQNYLTRNTLPKCLMHVPRNGFYQVRILCETTQDMEVLLDQHYSPASSLSTTVLNYADTASTVGTVGSLAIGAATLIPAIAVAPVAVAGAGVVGIGAGIYSAFRSMYGLYDRSNHRQSIGLENSEARGHWLTVAGGVLAGGAVGTTNLLTTAVEEGVAVGMASRTAFNVIASANVVVNGAGIVNSLYLFKCKSDSNESITSLEVLQFSASCLFFGHSVWNFQTASSFINERQNNVLADYEQRLSSNRKRKMFKKALKESQRIKGQEIGKADIICGLRKIENHNDFFGILVRNNKMFNEEGARFTVGANGQIEINKNIFIESSEFASMPVHSRRTFLANLPEGPPQTLTTNQHGTSLPARSTVTTTATTQPSRNRNLQATSESMVETDMLTQILQNFDLDTQNILKTTVNLFKEFLDDQLKSKVKRLYPFTDISIIIVQYLFEYLERCLDLDVGSLANDGIEFTLIQTLSSSLLALSEENNPLSNEMFNSMCAWINERHDNYIAEFRQLKRAMKTIREPCSVCGGGYYVPVK